MKQDVKSSIAYKEITSHINTLDKHRGESSIRAQNDDTYCTLIAEALQCLFDIWNDTITIPIRLFGENAEIIDVIFIGSSNSTIRVSMSMGKVPIILNNLEIESLYNIHESIKSFVEEMFTTEETITNYTSKVFVLKREILNNIETTLQSVDNNIILFKMPQYLQSADDIIQGIRLKLNVYPIYEILCVKNNTKYWKSFNPSVAQIEDVAVIYDKMQFEINS